MKNYQALFVVPSLIVFALAGCSGNDNSQNTDTDDRDAADSTDDIDTADKEDTENDTNGILNIIGLKDDDHVSGYTSGRINSNFEVPNTAGTWVQARLKITLKRCDATDPYVNGSWPAFWMLGSNSSERGYGGSVSWPSCGEIDIMEWIGSYDDTHYATNQWGSPGFTVDHNRPARVDFTIGPENWHVYGVRFNGGSITYTLDGQDLETKIYDDGEEHSHRIILNMALGGDMGGAIAEDFEYNILQIDWVRVTDASGTILWADEMDDENTTKSNWFVFMGNAYNNEKQYYTNWETDNFQWHNDPTLGECN